MVFAPGLENRSERVAEFRRHSLRRVWHLAAKKQKHAAAQGSGEEHSSAEAMPLHSSSARCRILRRGRHEHRHHGNPLCERGNAPDPDHLWRPRSELVERENRKGQRRVRSRLRGRLERPRRISAGGQGECAAVPQHLCEPVAERASGSHRFCFAKQQGHPLHRVFERGRQETRRETTGGKGGGALTEFQPNWRTNMKRYRYMALAFLTVVLAIGLFFSLLPKEPVYEGRPISAWIGQLTGGVGSSAGAVSSHTLPKLLEQKPGREIVPYLRQTLHRGTSLKDQAYAKIYFKLPAFLQRKLPMPNPARDAELRYRAGLIFYYMGPEAKEALRDLVESLKDPTAEVRRISATVLGSLGADAKSAAPGLTTA